MIMSSEGPTQQGAGPQQASHSPAWKGCGESAPRSCGRPNTRSTKPSPSKSPNVALACARTKPGPGAAAHAAWDGAGVRSASSNIGINNNIEHLLASTEPGQICPAQRPSFNDPDSVTSFYPLFSRASLGKSTVDELGFEPDFQLPRRPRSLTAVIPSSCGARESCSTR